MKAILDNFIFSNSNYCLFVWYFCSAAFSHKIEKVQERALGFSFSDSFSNYISLQLKVKQHTMEVSRMWNLAIEVLKTLKILKSRLQAQLFQQMFTLC